MFKLLKRFYTGLLLMALAAAPAMAGDIDDAKAVIEKLNQVFITQVKGREAELLANVEEIKKLAYEEVLPTFDTEKMAKYILGRGIWGTASETQKAEFVEAFSNMLVASYSKSLLKLNVDSMSILDAQLGDRPQLAQAVTKVYQKGNPNGTDVSYRLVKDDKGWKIYDVSVDGISLLVSYRKTYSQEVQIKGLDTVIRELRTYDLNAQDANKS